MHPQLRKSYVLLSCPILVVSDPRLSIDSQEYACNRSSIPITLVVRQAILSQNDLEKQTPVSHPYLGLGQSSCIPQIKCQSSFWFCTTLEYYLILYRDCYRNCTPSYELLVQWYFLPSLFIPRFLCYCHRNADKWIMVCEINTPSNLVAW